MATYNFLLKETERQSSFFFPVTQTVLCSPKSLRTFARKSSNMDNFIKLLIANELLVSDMQKLMGVTEFVFKI